MTNNNIYTIEQQAVTTALVFVVIILTCVLLLIANVVQEKVGEYGITVISKVMGLILASYAIQSILTGLKEFFTILH